MAGDWIKVEMETPDKPEVMYIAGILQIDPDAVFGKLFRVWSWFDKHTENGNALGVTYSLVDRITGVTGFAEAMVLAGWLKQDGSALLLPNFDRHNGKTAKNRALGAKRVLRSRSCNEKSNAASVTKSLPEKRREEKIKDSLGFAEPNHPQPLAERSASEGKGEERKKEAASPSAPNVWSIWDAIAPGKRPLLGKLIKEFGEERVAAKVGAMSVGKPLADPAAYLHATLRKRAVTDGLILDLGEVA